MTCKDCIHSGVCYKENDYDKFPDRCGDFISDEVLDERPQGEWMKIEAPSYTIIRCTCCGYKDNAIYIPNYCPECGADMRGGAGNDKID